MKPKSKKNSYFINLKMPLTFLFSVILFFEVHSQAFLPPYQPTFGEKQGYVILRDSTIIEGTFKLINQTKNIKSCIIKDKEGKKHNLKATQIEKVFILLTGWDKMNAYNEFTVSFQELLNLDFKEILKPEYYVWERVIIQKGKVKILQVVNPGFDTKIKVFLNPSGIQQGGDQFSQGEETSYYSIKDGNSMAVKVKKKTYSEQFNQLFGDCPQLVASVKDKKPEWRDFASHVYIYNELK